MTQPFTLGQILSITDGHLACDMDGVYAILNHLTGDNLSSIGLMAANGPCKAELLRQHPQLVDIHMPDAVAASGQAGITGWLAGLGQHLGHTLPVQPMKPGAWERRSLVDDIADIEDRGGRAIVLALPGVTS